MFKDWSFSRCLVAANKHANAIAYGLALSAVSAWTLLRFFNRPSIFDLVTQQVVARDWLHGNFSPMTFGATHYLLKLFVLYMPLDVLPGSPRLKLILLTLLINIVTFILFFKLIERILGELGLAKKHYLGGAMVWYAMIAGSAFWIQFANSRNLEVAGGLLVIYLGLKFLRAPTNKLTLGLAAFSSIIFFSDKLQVYMTALPLLVYGALMLRKKPQAKRYLALVGVLATGFIVSKALFLLAAHLLNVSFTASGSFALQYSPSQLIHAVPTSIKTMLTFFSGDADAGHAREVLNLIFLAVAAVTFVWGIFKRLISRQLGLLVLVFFVCDEAIYLISGQATVGDTGRYLVMLGPIAVMAVASLRAVIKSNRLMCIVFGLFIAFNGLTLIDSLARSWDTSFPKDAHLQSIAHYANQNHSTIIYGSLDSSLPVTYYQYAPSTSFVALACSSGKLVATQTVPASKLPLSTNGLTPLILDGSAITNAPSVCTQNMIISQLGPAKSISQTDDGSTVLIYSTASLASIR